MIKIKKLAAIMIFTPMLLLSACADGVSGFFSAEPEAEKTTISSKVYLPMEKIRTLNPIRLLDEDAYFIDKLIYDSLFVLDDSLAAENLLAANYVYAEDGLSAVIGLKQGVRWQDGESFTAEDVAFSVESYISAIGAHLYSDQVANIKSVKTDKDNPYQITIFFKSADKAGVENLTFPILPRHVYKNFSDLRNRAEDFIPLGTGPYKVLEYNSYSHLTLVGNPEYHSGAAPENQLLFQILPQRSDALNMLAVNAISFAVSKEENRDLIYRNPRVTATSFLSNEAVWICFNSEKELTRNKKIRQAIARAVDTEDILEAAYYKSGVLSDTVYFPGFLGVGKSADPYGFSMDEAKRLFGEGGLRDTDSDGILETETGEDAVINISVNSGSPSRTLAGQMIKSSLERLGLVCNLTVPESGNYGNAVSERNYDIYIGESQFRETFDLRFMLHSGYENPARYSNEELDRLLDSFVGANTGEKRGEIFQEIREILIEEIPYYCLLYKTYGAVSSPALLGTVKPTFHNIYRECVDWYCAYTAVAEEEKSEAAE
ncbi:MAG: ABC transporter substrate-binding protein [Clostridiales Family XIII bacterium]|jgi:peptide/nickel transport system substrate-binding protein|nr:ABC transporter substrate-binding protein [Clostridiales Family XIII bacterium]